MNGANTSWIGRKGRSPKENNSVPRMESKVASYASSHLICELNSIVNLFTAKQKHLAESTGFKSFANQLHPIQFDRQFTAWLMPKVDTMNRSIGTTPGKRIMIFQEDVAKVFGIPSSGKEVWDASLDKSQEMRMKIQGLIGMDEQFKSPSTAALKTLRALAGLELEDDQESVFKISFLVFVVSMICDSHNPGDVDSVNYWPALSNPDAVHMFNWASYVLESVFSACAAAKMATRRNIAFMPPAGSALFLHVSALFFERFMQRFFSFP